jgi:hypothetical protein
LDAVDRRVGELRLREVPLVDPLVDLLDEFEFLVQGDVSREFVAPVGDDVDGVRFPLELLGVDLDDPEFLGFALDGPTAGR